VNAPALAEYLHLKKTTSLSSCAYITVGTGIGVGLVCNNETVHGLMHPEVTTHFLSNLNITIPSHLNNIYFYSDFFQLNKKAGHIRVAKLPNDSFVGCCPYHGACVEGLCATVIAESMNSHYDLFKNKDFDFEAEE